ncbi:hypothetical protein [Faecalimicrobium sp. JNUCC 81]
MKNKKFYFAILIVSILLMALVIVSKSYTYITGKIILGFSTAFIVSSLMNIFDLNKL